MSFKKVKRQNWMRLLSDNVGKQGGHIGKIDWNTANHLYNQAKSPSDAATVIVKNQ